MSATLPTNFVPDHAPTAAEMGQVLSAITRITNIAVLNAITTASLAGSTSATYVDVTGASISWTKNGASANSDVGIFLLLSGAYTSVAPTTCRWGVGIGGTDYDLCEMIINAANTHTPFVAARAITGIGAGAYTPKLRFKRSAGTGAVTIDTGDTVSMWICELPK